MCVLAWLLMWCGAGEEEDEDDDDEEGEAEEERMRSGEEEQHVESLRKFRTQQAIRNLLLEREVKILQVRQGREGGRVRGMLALLEEWESGAWGVLI